MRVFILAAGFGKRLRPFTEKLPKPLIKVKIKPLIYWNLNHCFELIQPQIQVL